MRLSFNALHPKRRLYLVRLVVGLAFAVGLGAGLSGCGGDTLVADSGVGSGGTGITQGSITGFGSVVVDGQHLDYADAKIEVESEPGMPNKPGVDSTTLHLGQQVVVDNDSAATVAKTIRVLPMLIGVVESVDLVNHTLVVAGQTVVVNTTTGSGNPTAFDGLENLAELNVGDAVMVHGHLQPLTLGGTQIRASRIVLQPTTDTQVRVTGKIQNLNVPLKQFTVGALTVSFSDSVKLLPTGTTVANLANGQRVVAWGPSAVAAGVLQAQTISAASTAIAGHAVRIGGLVSGCSGVCGNTFVLDGLTVNATSARYTGATADQLVDGKYAVVVGKADSQTGVIVASLVAQRAAGDYDVSLRGTVSSLIVGPTVTLFNLRGQTVVLPSSTTIPPGCSIANGQAVKIDGAIVANWVRAQVVTCLPSLEGLSVNLTGTVSSVNTAAATFVLNGQLATLSVAADKANFVDGTLAGMANGQYVVVLGKVTGGVLVASNIRVATALASNLFETQGRVYAVTATVFRINGLLVHYASSAVTNGPLLQGDQARVVFSVNSDGSVTATSVQVLTP